MTYPCIPLLAVIECPDIMKAEIKRYHNKECEYETNQIVYPDNTGK